MRKRCKKEGCQSKATRTYMEDDGDWPMCTFHGIVHENKILTPKEDPEVDRRERDPMWTLPQESDQYHVHVSHIRTLGDLQRDPGVPSRTRWRGHGVLPAAAGLQPRIQLPPVPKHWLRRDQGSTDT